MHHEHTIIIEEDESDHDNDSDGALAFRAGTAKNLNLFDSKLNKYKIAFSLMLVGFL